MVGNLEADGLPLVPAHQSSRVIPMKGVQPSPWEYLSLGGTESERTEPYRHLVDKVISAEVIQKIRKCVNTGLVLENEIFRDKVEAL